MRDAHSTRDRRGTNHSDLFRQLVKWKKYETLVGILYISYLQKNIYSNFTFDEGQEKQAMDV